MNRLQNETSPYLLQHAENPVDWYPWGPEAFEKAKVEDKPVFLSIGYSTCHWCHVMAHESFEDPEIAEILNDSFISIKVDKQERPDLDAIYMAVCQAFTGSGGWPTSIFLTWEQKPFFAGTYFPKLTRHRMLGFRELLNRIRAGWEHDRESLLSLADEVVSDLRHLSKSNTPFPDDLIDKAMADFRAVYDREYGGFGMPTKFPSPHVLLFLLAHYEKTGDTEALAMVEGTLRGLYRGGQFDHIGYGFCRYATDRAFLIPHFEKMLYDNALLLLAYAQGYETTGNPLYRQVAEKTAAYLQSELSAPGGGFYSAQDADSNGQEGAYYLFTRDELLKLLGRRDGNAFITHFGITEGGHLDGKSIPNLLSAHSDTANFDPLLSKLRVYRKERTPLYTDDTILAAWNHFAIAGFCALYKITGNPEHLRIARDTIEFVENNLFVGDTLHTSIRLGKQGAPGFLEDYASLLFALLALYDVTWDTAYLHQAETILKKTLTGFFDNRVGGFFLTRKDGEELILRPKECYDGATPSGNSLMAYALVRLNHLLPEHSLEAITEKQLSFLEKEAGAAPTGHSMFLLALSHRRNPPMLVTISPAGPLSPDLPQRMPQGSLVRILERPDPNYPPLFGKTAFYVCHGNACLPPMTEEEFVSFLKRERRM